MKFSSTRLLWVVVLMLISIAAFSVPVFAHGTYFMGSSQWNFSENEIKAALVLDSSLLDQIKQAKESNIRFDSIPENNLKQSINKIIQPYLDQNLSVWINDKKYLVKVTDIKREEGRHYRISMEMAPIALKNGANSVKIEYKMFFAETGDIHVNVATFTTSGLDISDKEYVFTPSEPAWEGTLTRPDAVGSGIKPSTSGGQAGQTDSKGNTTGKYSFWGNIGQFVLLGIKHILTGYDHILFLLALVVIGLSFRDVLRIITSFTVAHSITLLLAALQIVRLSPRFVEPAIALSICYISIENILRREAKQRWIVTFCFGLIHGFGFASILQGIFIEKSNLVYSVLSFNIGVEMGQFLIFLVILPILYLLKKKFPFRDITVYVSVFVFVLGLVWLMERVFGFIYI